MGIYKRSTKFTLPVVRTTYLVIHPLITVIAILCFLCPIAAQAETNRAQVSTVYDGDTVKIKRGKKSYKLRLAGIDAPERNQPFGLKSRRALAALCQGKNSNIHVTISGKDHYQRALGSLECNGIDASLHQVAHGWAWHYKQYSRDTTLQQAEKNARQDRLGLWVDDQPVPPWEWRRISKRCSFC